MIDDGAKNHVDGASTKMLPQPDAWRPDDETITRPSVPTARPSGLRTAAILGAAAAVTLTATQHALAAPTAPCGRQLAAWLTAGTGGLVVAWGVEARWPQPWARHGLSWGLAHLAAVAGGLNLCAAAAQLRAARRSTASGCDPATSYIAAALFTVAAACQFGSHAFNRSSRALEASPAAV